MRQLFLAAAALFSAASVAGAGVVVDSQNRFVDANITNPAANDHKAAPDSLPFSETAQVNVVFQQSPSQVTATQSSSFGVAADTLTASVVSSGALNTGTLPGSFADANSLFELNFTITTPGTYSLTGAAAVLGALPDPGFYSSYIIRLEGPGNTTVFDFRDESLPPNVNDDLFNEAGALAAGSYKFIARALSTGTGNVNESANLEITFSVNAPGGGGLQAPLPAAIWPGLALGAMALRRARSCGR